MSDVSFNQNMLDLHMSWQRTMKKPEVPGEIVEKALRKIISGEIESAKYPGGFPCLKPTYEIALRLQQEQSTVQ